jgi:hypothetical protein
VLVVAPGERLAVAPGETAGRVEAALDGGVMEPLPGGALEAPLQPGGHWLATLTRDAAGTTSEVRWVRLVVDAEAPRLEIDVEPPPVARGERLWVSAAARAVARAWDEPAGVARCTLRCGATVAEARVSAADPSRAEAECALPAGAPAVLTAAAEDRVGNGVETARRDLWIDAAAPSARLAVEGWAVAGAVGPVLAPSARLTIATADGQSGVAGVEIRLDGETVESLDDLETGEHRAEVVAVDGVGNRSPAAGLDFGYDAEAPRLQAAWVVDGGVPVRLQVVAEDAPAGLAALEWTAEGGPWRALLDGGPATLADLDAAGVRRRVALDLRVAPAAADDQAAAGTVPPAALTVAALDRVGNRSELAVPWPPPTGAAAQGGER